MAREIIYGIGGPHFESRWVLILNTLFRILFLVAKFFIFLCKIPFSGGIDGKKVIKE